MFVGTKKIGIIAFIAVVIMTACENPTGQLQPDQTPVAEDFQISNLSQSISNVTAVIITPKTGKSAGALTVYYEGLDGAAYAKKTALPAAIGKYAISFDVAAVTGWNAAAGLSAGTLTVFQDPVVYDFRVNENPVMRVPYSSEPVSVHFHNLHNNSIYLMKVNISNSFVYAPDTGSIRPSPQSLFPAGTEIPFIGHPAATQLMANPLRIVEESPRRRAAFIPAVVGDEKEFFVESVYNSSQYLLKTARLTATGQYCNIWVMNENYSVTTVGKPNNKITTSQAVILAAKFDAMYPAATNLLGGYPFGHGPNEDGGRDQDPRFQVLVYGIGNNVAGYFYTADWYPKSQLSHSNESEIIYLDVTVINTLPDFSYSCLAHELQHAIQFNMKWVKYGKRSETWFQELCSLMMEDVLAQEYLDIDPLNSYHVTRYRIPEFLQYGNPHITDFALSGAEYFSYGCTYAYGAILLRSFGPEILRNILTNDLTNFESISSALDGFSSGLTFEQSLMLMGEAMVFSGPQMPESVTSYDRTMTSKINNFTYTARGFDLWRDFSRKGPVISDLEQKSMSPNSLSVHLTDEWKNRSGEFTITLDGQIDENIVCIFMVQ